MTDAATIRPFSRVDSHVVVKVAFFTEDFCANYTGVRHLTGTHFLMSGLMVALPMGQAGIEDPSKLHFPSVRGNAPKWTK